jgi:hypothetical protein
VKLVRETRAARGGGARSAVQRKALQGRSPGASRFSANSSLERQADEAAEAAVRKQRNVARVLTPAPPARYSAPASAGGVLPQPVRAEMEEAFGAELSELRVHHDGAAHAAARLEEARAFTAGRDIYFGQGAHVLQQTGRRTSTTLISATAREGAGEVQKQGDAQASGRRPRFTESGRRYGATLARLRAEARPGPKEPPDGD